MWISGIFVAQSLSCWRLIGQPFQELLLNQLQLRFNLASLSKSRCFTAVVVVALGANPPSTKEKIIAASENTKTNKKSLSLEKSVNNSRISVMRAFTSFFKTRPIHSISIAVGTDREIQRLIRTNFSTIK